MSMKRFIQSTRVRIVAVVVSVTMAVAGLVVWNPVGLYAQAADEPGECIVGQNTIEQCFSPTVADAVYAELKRKVSSQYTKTSVLDQNAVDKLKSLRISGPESLKNLDKFINLEELELSEAPNIPSGDYAFLRNFTSLKKLDLHSGNFADLSLLDGMTGLTDLNVSACRSLTNIEHLAQFTNLESLEARSDRIGARSFNEWISDETGTKPQSNVAWVANLTKLKTLDLSSNVIQDPSAIGGLTHLTSLKLQGNRIIDITSLAGILPVLQAFDAREQVGEYRPYTVRTPDEVYRLETGVINRTTGNYAAIDRTEPPSHGSTPPDGVVSGSIAEWPSPKIGEYGLHFNSILPKGFIFEGAISQEVRAKVEFLDENNQEITTNKPSNTAFPTQIVNSANRKVTFPEVEPRVGHTPCWKLDLSKSECITADHLFDSMTRVYLSWSPIKYHVSYETQLPGVTPPTSPDVAYNDKVTKPTDPSAHGYKFLGWSTSQNASGGPYYDFANTPVTGDVKLYAQWEKLPFPVKFVDAVDGTPVAQDQSVLFEGKASKPSDPTKNGYTFLGWTADQAGTIPFDFANTGIQDATTVYAQWKKNQYTVSFDTQDPQVANPASQTVEYQDKATKPTEVGNKPGYVFAGWTTDKEGKHPYTFDTPVTGNITVYGQWTKAKVHFDEQTEKPVVTTGINSTGLPDKPVDPKLEGSTFVGWSLTPDGSKPYDFSTPLPDGTTLYGVWKPIENTVTFDSQGGSAVNEQHVQYKKSANKPAGPTREGFKFLGWTLDPEGKNPFDFSTKIKANTKVYAQWQKIDVPASSSGSASHNNAVQEHSAKDPATNVDPDVAPKDTPKTVDSVTESAPSQEDPGILARTGSDVLGVLGFGLTMLVAALAAMWISRKRSAK